ncbi:hypothetical protein [Kitasatospora sp. GP82]|uniref:hypothetical protein n=1 Tax=Kitasatospora sp. GP82 TaxID=3035089 RepID=UPI0024737A44|nr:hypothetical protein [Kitasatospora sp. GP82]MDH6130539.1 hypothetical protein [Kitasatospora sp. GP82]
MPLSPDYTPTATMVQQCIDGHGDRFAQVFGEYFAALHRGFDADYRKAQHR